MTLDERMQIVREQFESLRQEAGNSDVNTDTHVVIYELLESELEYEYTRKQNIEFRSSIFIALLTTISAYIFQNYNPYLDSFFSNGTIILNRYFIITIMSSVVLFFLIKSYYYFFKTLENANFDRFIISKFEKKHFDAEYRIFIEDLYKIKVKNYNVATKVISQKAENYDKAIYSLKFFLIILLIRFIFEIIIKWNY